MGEGGVVGTLYPAGNDSNQYYNLHVERFRKPPPDAFPGERNLLDRINEIYRLGLQPMSSVQKDFTLLFQMLC